MPENNNLKFEVTESAAKQFLNIMKENNVPEEYSLRISVEGDMHSGIQYNLGFDSTQNTDDIKLEANGLKLLIDPESAPLLNGSTLDFSEGGCCGGGFAINNPNIENRFSCHDHE